MRSNDTLSGGTNGGGTVQIPMHLARERLEAKTAASGPKKRREIYIPSRKDKGKEPVTKKKEGDQVLEGRKPTSSRELVGYVDECAGDAYEFVLEMLKFMRQLDHDVRQFGDVMYDDLCEGSDQLKRDRKEDYESTIEILRSFEPADNAILRDEAEIPAREKFVQGLCLRMRHITELALLVDGLSNAESKEEFDGIIAKTMSDRFIFALSNDSEDSPIRAFGRGYDLVDGAFGFWNDFARDKIAEAAGRSRELAKAHRDKEARQKEALLEQDEQTVSPEELLFGDPKHVNGKSASFAWEYAGHPQVIKLQRADDLLFVLDAVGKPRETLDKMRDEWAKPRIVLSCILAPDGKHLCPEKDTGTQHYQFSGFIKEPLNLSMSRWVRTAAGRCLPHRLFHNERLTETAAGGTKPNGGKERLVKTQGELMTPQEFYYKRGLGEYDLVYEPGFHYTPNDETDQPKGPQLDITERATARIERKQGSDGKDTIVLHYASTKQLADLLEAGGDVKTFVGTGNEGQFIVYGEFPDTPKFAQITPPLRLGLMQDFRRLKESEASASSSNS